MIVCQQRGEKCGVRHKAGIQTVYKMNNKLNSRIIKRGKDILPKENIKGVVYQLNCNDYDAVYVGETKRRINTRSKNMKITFDWSLPLILS